MAARRDGSFEVSLFGSLRVRHRGEPLVLAAPPKTAPLLAALVLARDRTLPRDRLAFMLWPDEIAATARANLRRHLHYLSRALPQTGTPWFCADAREVHWNRELPLVVDVERFETLLDAGRRAEAAALYAGDLLEDIDEDWLDGERTRLRTRHLENLAALIAQDVAARRHRDVAAHAQALLACDPWREDALRALMSAHLQLGDRAAALAAYARFERELRQEVGSDPMPETRTLRDRIAANGVAFPAEHRSRAHAIGAGTALIARDVELGRLRSVYRHAVYGQGGVVFLTGEAGIGKSRLLGAFRECIDYDRATFAAGGTSMPESGPYEAPLEALRSVAPQLADAALRPALEAAAQPEQLRRQLFDALAEAFRSLARDKPLVVALDDLHWAGPSTCVLVADLAERLADVPIVIVATYRDDEVGAEHPVHLLRRRLRSTAEHVALRPFKGADVERFIADLTGAHVPAAIVAGFERHAGGNPFALSELLRDGLESGSVRIEQRTLVVDTFGVPRLLGHVIAARAERLSPTARAVAGVAAVVGRRFDLQVVARASGLDESRTAAALDELLDRRLAHDLGKGHFAFVHEAVAGAIFAHTDADDRRRRHRRVADALEEVHGERAVAIARELAHHREAAGDARGAARHHLLAAEQALALFAHDEVAERVERVLASSDDTRTRAQALLLREELARRAGDRARQERDLAELEQNAAVAADEELRCELLRRRAVLAHVLGDRRAEDAAIGELRDRAVAAGSVHWETIALLRRATADIAAGRFQPARTALERARELASSGDAALAVDVRCNLANLAVHCAEYDAADCVLDEAWNLAGNDEGLRYRVLHGRNLTARARERFDRVHLLARELLAYSQRVGDRRSEMFNHLRLANAALFVFGIEEAREHYQVAEEMARGLGSPRDRSTVALCRGIFAHALGDTSEGRLRFEAARAIAEADGDRFGTVLAEINLAAAEYAAGDFTEAVNRARACVEPARELGALEIEAAAYCTAGAALRRLGRAAEAVASLARGVEMERAAGLRWTVGQDLAELTLAQLDAGDLNATRSAVDELEDLAATSYGGLTHPQFILAAAARAARAHGENERAERLFEMARAAYDARSSQLDEPARERFSRAWFNEGLVLVDVF